MPWLPYSRPMPDALKPPKGAAGSGPKRLMPNIPVVFEDLVIASAVVTGWGDTARPAHRFLGMDAKTGEVRWMNGTKELPEDTTYSTPSIADFGGQAALVFGSSDGSVWNFQPRTGKAVWNFKLSRRGLNVPPLVEGTTVYMSQAEENLDNTTMGSVTAFDATAVPPAAPAAPAPAAAGAPAAPPGPPAQTPTSQRWR